MDRKILERIFRKVGKKYPYLKLAYLHGSHVGYTPTPLSDVDIALVLDSSFDKKAKWDLEFDLENFLEKSFGDLEFDVRVMNGTHLDFQGKVITHGELLYAAEDLFRADYEEKTRKLYFDFKPFIDRYCEERLATIREEGLTHD